MVYVLHLFVYDFFSLPPAERLTRIIDGMFLSITRRGMPGFRVVPIPNLLLTLIWNRLSRLKQRLLRALATPYIPRRRKPVVREPRMHPQPAPPHVVPRYKAWLLHLIQETGGAGTQLAHCLNQPDAIALLEADPRLGRILRPLCHALGVRPQCVPVLYPKHAPKAAPSASPTPSGAPPPPEAKQVAPVAAPSIASPPAIPPQTPPPSSRAPPFALA